MTEQSLIEPHELQEILQRFDTIRSEIGKHFIGPEQVTEALMVALIARGHVLIEGVPGIAKTTLVKAFAQTLSCSFRRIQFTPDLLPSDITGTYIFNRKTESFVLHEGPVFANVLLGDEINRSPAKTQAALLEAMQEEQVTIEGTTKVLQRPFFVLATQNPIEQEGVYPLPEAQLDRFLIKLDMDYPTLAQEERILIEHAMMPPAIVPVLEPEEIIRWEELSEMVSVKPELITYIVKLVRFTRQAPEVALGASPRASIALLRSARARALLRGRPYVLPDDIKAMAPLVLCHRVLLQPEAELGGATPLDLVNLALERSTYAGSR